MILALVGPTATGKSELSLRLAQALGADDQLRARFPGGIEVISADAFQLYRGMDIGTAKVTLSQRRQVPHHQIDQLWPDEEASVATYQEKARADVLEIQSRHALPVVVGGSGLYVRALLDQLNFPPTDPAVRSRWEERLHAAGPQALHQVLAQLDPQAACAINPLNARRLVRALEAIEITGQPFSANLPSGEYWQAQTLQFYVTRPAAELEARIAIRSQLMFDQGLMDECQALLADTRHPLGLTAAKATGYSQAIAVLRGELEVEQAVAETALATRQLARRQHKWFKRDLRLHYLELRDPNAINAINTINAINATPQTTASETASTPMASTGEGTAPTENTAPTAYTPEAAVAQIIAVLRESAEPGPG